MYLEKGMWKISIIFFIWSVLCCSDAILDILSLIYICYENLLHRFLFMLKIVCKLALCFCWPVQTSIRVLL